MDFDGFWPLYHGLLCILVSKSEIPVKIFFCSPDLLRINWGKPLGIRVGIVFFYKGKIHTTSEKLISRFWTMDFDQPSDILWDTSVLYCIFGCFWLNFAGGLAKCHIIKSRNEFSRCSTYFSFIENHVSDSYTQRFFPINS